jgi:hypothetical protein
MTLQAMTSIISTLIAILSATVAILVFRRQRRLADFELARSLHQDLTSGEVARARDLLANLAYRGGGHTLEEAPAIEAVRSAYFTVLWCFERIDAGRFVLTDSPAARTFLDELISWHVTEWWHRMTDIRPVLSNQLTEFDDAHSRRSLDRLAALLTPQGLGNHPARHDVVSDAPG